MPKLIWVKSGRDDGRVALFEQSNVHPDGEAFVTGPPVQVALTTLVERKLASGELVETEEPKPQTEDVYKSKDEVDEAIRLAKAGATEEVEAEDEGPFNPIRVGERPERRKPGRPKKES